MESPKPPTPQAAESPEPGPTTGSTQPTRENLIKAAQTQNLESVKAILKAGNKAELVTVMKNAGTWGACHHEGALHSAIFGLKRGADENERRVWLDIMKALLDAGADPNDEFEQYDWRGCGKTETAFELVLQRGALEDLALLRVFLNAGADPTVVQRRSTRSMRTDASSSHTPLHTVVARGVAVDCAVALLRAGADVNARRTERMQNERGAGQDLDETSLHVAVARRDTAMCAALLGHGADVNATRRSLHQEHLEVASPTTDPRDPTFVPSVRLVEVEQTALHLAIEAGDADLARLLVLHKADTSAARRFGDTRNSAKELCAEHEDPELRERLLAALDAKWSPDTHMLFPETFKASVRATLLTAKRQDWGLPSEVLGDIFRSAA